MMLGDRELRHDRIAILRKRPIIVRGVNAPCYLGFAQLIDCRSRSSHCRYSWRHSDGSNPREFASIAMQMSQIKETYIITAQHKH